MTTTLLSSPIWDRITALARKAAESYVAVAYLGQGARKLLPLRSGSTLVVDMSLNAVQHGNTSPKEVVKFLRRGVHVHSCSNLHAKVFVFDGRALVGSTNISCRSANTLIEAVIETDESEVVKSCVQFIKSLRGDRIDLEYAKKMELLYRPPKVPGPKVATVPLHSPVWVAPCEYEAWDEEGNQVAEKTEPLAQKLLKPGEGFHLETFCYPAADWLGRAKVGDMVAMLTQQTGKPDLLAPPSRILLIQSYKLSTRDRMIIFLKQPDKMRRKRFDVVLKKLGPEAERWLTLKSPRLLRDPIMVHKLLNLWSS